MAVMPRSRRADGEVSTGATCGSICPPTSSYRYPPQHVGIPVFSEQKTPVVGIPL